MRLKYKAVAKIKDNSGAAKPLFPMEAKRPILITQNALQNMKENRSLTLDKNIKTMFFVKQGNSKVDVTFNKDCFVLGDTASAIVNIDNSKCEKDIKNVKFKLRRLIHGIAKDTWKFKFNKTLKKIEYPGI